MAQIASFAIRCAKHATVLCPLTVSLVPQVLLSRLRIIHVLLEIATGSAKLAMEISLQTAFPVFQARIFSFPIHHAYPVTPTDTFQMVIIVLLVIQAVRLAMVRGVLLASHAKRTFTSIHLITLASQIVIHSAGSQMAHNAPLATQVVKRAMALWLQIASLVLSTPAIWFHQITHVSPVLSVNTLQMA